MPAERIQRLRERDEVARNEPRALMDQLVERMLAVGAGFAPVDRAGGVVHAACRRASRACRCSPSSAAAGRRESASGIARRAGRRPSAHRRNRCTRRASSPSSTGRLRSNGAVRKCSSISWKPASIARKFVGSDGEHRRQADGRIHRIAAAHPVPEAEHVCGVDAELRHLRRVGRHGDEMLRHRLGVAAQPAQRPVARGMRVGHRLERRERLRRDDEQRLRGVEVRARPRRNRCRRRWTRSGTSSRGRCSACSAS